MRYPPCPGNAPGPFYVEDNNCIACEAPVLEAPDLMDFQGEPDYSHQCRFRRQPETQEELQRAINAVQVCCCGAVRYGGNDKTILDRINDPSVCDALSEWDDHTHTES
jgi:hypothetical protein